MKNLLKILIVNAIFLNGIGSQSCSYDTVTTIVYYSVTQGEIDRGEMIQVNFTL